MAGGKMYCQGKDGTCGKNLSMSGSLVCPVCVPDPLDHSPEARAKDIPRCLECFEAHMEEHGAKGELPMSDAGCGGGCCDC